jgi:hypothetical protein
VRSLQEPHPFRHYETLTIETPKQLLNQQVSIGPIDTGTNANRSSKQLEKANQSILETLHPGSNVSSERPWQPAKENPASVSTDERIQTDRIEQHT